MLFYQYYAEISTFLVKNCSFHLLPTTLMSECLAEMMSMLQRQPHLMHGSRLTTRGRKMTFPCTGVKGIFLLGMQESVLRSIPSMKRIFVV